MGRNIMHFTSNIQLSIQLFFFLFSMLMLAKCKKCSFYFCDYAEHKANFKDSSTVNPKTMKVDANVFKRDLGNI